MKNYDSHIHIGKYEDNKFLIENSEYRHKYKLYNAINTELIHLQDEYIKKLDNFFAIPLFFKETNIEDCNQYVIDYCKKINKGIPTLLINNNNKFSDNYNIALFKEHFLLNDFLDWKDRSNYYDFLADNDGFLLIHCKDKIRIEYIKKLIDNFPKMNIIIAHLGRDAHENQDFIKNMLQEFNNNEKILFDLSTIHNIDNIIQAIRIAGDERILYGSDFPFEYNDIDDIIIFKNILMKSLDCNKNIFEKNFDRVRQKVYVKR